MDILQSPWLAELKRTRRPEVLATNTHSDVVIVGGGIAGVTTAFFILKYTNCTVTLLEASNIAHGATGHNGGYLATYFERPFFQLADQFGLAMAEQGREEVEQSWDLLAEMIEDSKISTPLWEVTGWAGSRNLEELLIRLKNRLYREKIGNPQVNVLISETAPFLASIPKEYEHLYSLVPHADILSLLETNDTTFTAALPAKKGCMNSALFTEELCGFLLSKFRQRFSVYEHSPVRRIVLKQDRAVASVKGKVVSGHRLVLCTNGFENFTIVNTVGADIDASFHHSVRGSVGYMAAYLEERKHQPAAVSYLPQKYIAATDVYLSEPYFYLSRRPFELENSERHNLICVGGPELLLPDSNLYIRDEHAYPDEVVQAFNEFIHTSYKYAPTGPIDFTYKWHGLMGYTPNGVRMVGFEPINPVLLYNLGCNGLGLLPSISGARRISRLVNGDQLAPSIFDPQDSRGVVGR